jgi:hypothetical protein
MYKQLNGFKKNRNEQRSELPESSNKQPNEIRKIIQQMKQGVESLELKTSIIQILKKLS